MSIIVVLQNYHQIPRRNHQLTLQLFIRSRCDLQTAIDSAATTTDASAVYASENFHIIVLPSNLSTNLMLFACALGAAEPEFHTKTGGFRKLTAEFGTCVCVARMPAERVCLPI